MTNAQSDLKGGRALIIVGPQYEDLEAWYPRLRFMEAGMEVIIAGIGDKEYTGKKGHTIAVDADASELVDESFDIVVVVGGFAPDAVRMNDAVLRIVRKHMKESVVASICHGPWVLASAGVLEGRTVTAFKSLKDDLTNAGAKFVDKEVVVDGNLVTSRNPFDLPAFCKASLGLLQKQVAPGQSR
jgi:protease I